MPVKETIKRYVMFICGLFVLALGTVIAIKSSLGTAPIASLPYVMSLIFTKITLGTFTFILCMLFLAAQIILLRKDFKLYQLLQIPISLFFGNFQDVWMFVLKNVNPEEYLPRFLLLLLGCVVTALGVSIVVTANVAMDSAQALIVTISNKYRLKFGRVKVISDVSIVIIAAVISVSVFHKLIGIREGTVIAAISVGLIAGFFNKHLRWVEKFLVTKK